MIHHGRWRAMGSQAHVVVLGPDLTDLARTRVEHYESLWSRFRPASELCRLNAAGHLRVSAETRLLLERCHDAAQLTRGRFDATLLHRLVALGYDRSFELVGGAVAGGPASLALPVPSRAGPPWEFGSHGEVRLAPGVAVDPGGIGKGLAADLVSAELMAAGAEGVCVNLGGDLRVRGAAPHPAGWVVGLEDPRDPTVVVEQVALAAGACATSSPLRRAWAGVHHLLDPGTGRPSTSDVVACSVLAGEAWVAEAVAKAAVIAGSVAGLALLEDVGLAAVLLDRSGARTCSSTAPAFVRSSAPAG